MDSVTALRQLLAISEASIAASNHIGTWVSVALAIIGIIFAAAVAFFSYRYFQDKKLVQEKIDNATTFAFNGLQSRFDQRFEQDRTLFKESLEPIRKEISLIWLRKVIKSDNKDPHDLRKALSMAMDNKEDSTIVPLIAELHSYAVKNAHIVGGYAWAIWNFEPLLAQAKEYFKEDPDNLEMVTGYTEAIASIAASNLAAKEAAKKKPSGVIPKGGPLPAA
jgi:hypothetical protein